MKNLLIIAFLLILPLTANAKIGGFVKGISETDKLELSSLVVDNISIDGNTISTTGGTDFFLTPLAGQDLIIDGHLEFDANLLTAITDNDTIFAAYAGKNFTIESVTFDGGAVGGVTTLGLSGAITGATATDTINGVIINSSAMSSITTLAMAGALSGVTGLTMSGTLAVTDTASNAKIIVKRSDSATATGRIDFVGSDDVADVSFGTNYLIGAGAEINVGGSNIIYIPVANGNVGIGLTDPDEALEVSGNVKIGDGSANIVILKQTSVGVYSTEGAGVAVADDATVALPDLTGFCKVAVEGAGDEWAFVHVDDDGAVTLISNSTNVDNADTDAKLCIFDNGASAVVKNRLGTSKDLIITFEGL